MQQAFTFSLTDESRADFPARAAGDSLRLPRQVKGRPTEGANDAQGERDDDGHRTQAELNVE